MRPTRLAARSVVLRTSAIALIAWWLIPFGYLLRSSDQLEMWVLAVGDGSGLAVGGAVGCGVLHALTSNNIKVTAHNDIFLRSIDFLLT